MFYFFLPYRVKNPISRLPIATWAIIAINVLVYACTTDYFISVRTDVLHHYGVLVGVTPAYTLITASFLHAEPLHLLSNMVMLWVFGPSVEERLGIPIYVAMYLIAGAVGDLLHAAVSMGMAGSGLYSLGASGCIMGVLGAYWYMFSWSPVCIFYFVWLLVRIWVGVWEVAAIWVIGLYVLLEIVNGMLSKAAGAIGGVGHFAHIGGVFTGILLCVLLRQKRDSEALSEARAVHADAKDLTNVPVYSLRTMSEADPTNGDIIRAMIPPALSMGQERYVHEAIARGGRQLLQQDPDLIAHYLTDVNGDASQYTGPELLRMGSHLERMGDATRAVKIYSMLIKVHPQAPDVEMALFWTAFRDGAKAQACIREMEKHFPSGELATYRDNLRRQMGQAT